MDTADDLDRYVVDRPEEGVFTVHRDIFAQTQRLRRLTALTDGAILPGVPLRFRFFRGVIHG